ncbi:FeoB-associated Cys-rich membrane protein [Desulfococcaceae bacterium HSG8]|nr:FeoB-associated Cys-rich membrane protein [Desulfococcaceae bacterium HSG8]
MKYKTLYIRSEINSGKGVRMEILLIILIVGSATIYLIINFYKSMKNHGSCGCGCSSCNIEADCHKPEFIE